jgi:hypothetical protein
MHFVITSDQDVSIDGIGTLTGGEPKKVSAQELAMFEVMNRVKLANANFPNFVTVEYDLDEKEV